MTTSDRFLLYVLATPLLMVIGFIGAGGAFDAACQNDAEATDCDLGFFYAAEGAFVALLVCMFAILVIEAVARGRSR